ncbi:DNA polymerase delta subunit 2 isoform X2 [Nilaparvata lugens]|uniref:DNA polymerase delta subunit 2 isoform X2 n=1 Tax=Nilaparvata lugens TaxID=108931 RepID=UPI00193DE46B|nr:DNA polymerase delta subunit 2 isoform X2 [Nilaparvata lugens]
MKLHENSSSGCLLQGPNDLDASDKVFQRVSSTYNNLSLKFRHRAKDFSKQFAHIYAARLNEQRSTLLEKVHKKWGTGVKVVRLAELGELSGEKCVIIGTLFKDQELKPSILKEISEELNMPAQPSNNRYTSSTDKLILEDELQRITLFGCIEVTSLVTGVISAILGHEDDGGKFSVEDVCWVGTVFPPENPIKLESDRFLVLVSGLDLKSNNAESALALELLVDWLSGWIGEPNDQQHASRVARLIIAGNAVSASPEKKEKTTVVETARVEESSSVLSAVQQLDNLLEQLVINMPVDLMPGEFDPSNHSLPQQPLHFCMFPKAANYKTMNGVPNPYACEMDGRLLVGTSGQPIADVLRFSDVTDPISALESTLTWGHIAPTAPDTLDCYPYYNSDPFILGQQPDVYFVGNQETFQTKIVDVQNPGAETKSYKTRLVCVPSFSKTRTCVLVNLRDLECYPMTFGSS